MDIRVYEKVENETKDEEPKVDDFIETRKITPVFEEVLIEEHDEQEHKKKKFEPLTIGDIVEIKKSKEK